MSRFVSHSCLPYRVHPSECCRASDTRARATVSVYTWVPGQAVSGTFQSPFPATLTGTTCSETGKERSQRFSNSTPLAANARLRPLRCVQRFDDPFDVLRRGMRHHEHGIGRLDDDIALSADDRDESPARRDIAVPAALGDDVAAKHVPFRVLVDDLVQCRPGADVAPARVERHDGGRVRVLHYGIIDRIRRRGGESGAEPSKIGVSGRLYRCPPASLRYRGRTACKLVEIALCGEDEHAAVPEVAARFDIGFSRRSVWLLHESLEPIP